MHDDAHHNHDHGHNPDDETKLIDTGDGLVKLSIFEDGVPPRFRLHFVDALGHVKTPPLDNVVTVDTVRVPGERQRFIFELRGTNYLEATETLAEPHEFAATVTIAHENQVDSYEIQFTEHDHHHTLREHGHVHHTGWRRVLEELVRPHSHDAVDSIDDALASSEEGIRAVKRSLIALGATALLQLGVVMMSGSVSLLADTIHNFGDAATALPLWAAFSLSRRAVNRGYTYGYSRAEDIAGVSVVLVIALSAAVAGWESLQRLIYPQPVTHLGWVALAGVLGFLGNELVARYRIRAGERIGSAALIADGYHARTDGFTSLAVLAGTGGVWLGFPQADPLVGLGITIAILVLLRDAALQIWSRLMDAVDPRVTEQAERAALSAAGVQAVGHVRIRWIGHTMKAEALIVADPLLSLREAHAVAERARHAMLHAVPKLSGVTIHVDPAGSEGDDPHAELAHHDNGPAVAAHSHKGRPVHSH